jgi:hypothetical protein
MLASASDKRYLLGVAQHLGGPRERTVPELSSLPLASYVRLTRHEAQALSLLRLWAVCPVGGG